MSIPRRIRRAKFADRLRNNAATGSFSTAKEKGERQGDAFGESGEKESKEAGSESACKETGGESAREESREESADKEGLAEACGGTGTGCRAGGSGRNGDRRIGSAGWDGGGGSGQ